MIWRKRFVFILVLLAVVWWTGIVYGQEKYEKPPREILDVLDAPLPPTLIFSPSGDMAVLVQRVQYPPIADLAEPMLRLAGVRINPRTNAGRNYLLYWSGLALKRLPDGVEIPILLPERVKRIGTPEWNANSTMFAFTNEAFDGVELWVVDTTSREAKLMPGLHLNPVLDYAWQWMPDQETLLVKLIPADRGAPPEPPLVPPGPKIQESSGAKYASSTYEVRDVLKNPYEADLFDYYTKSQPALVKVPGGEVTLIGKPDVYGQVIPALGGSYLLVERIHRPYSYQRAYYRFPKEIELWTAAGTLIETLASQPLAEQVPIRGEITGPRDFSWRDNAPATVYWVEALDGGDPKTKVPFRDRVMIKPIGGEAIELWKSEQRFRSLQWIEQGGSVLASSYDDDLRRTRTYLLNADNPTVAPRLIWDISMDEEYKDPGYFVHRMLPNGSYVVMQKGDWVYLSGLGASPEGDRPFLDRLNLQTFDTERLFRSDRSCLESFIDWKDPGAGTFYTKRESLTDPPNYYLRTLARSPMKGVPAGEAVLKSTSRAITHFPDPVPHLKGITKRLVNYTRADGLPLSFMLYLPAGYKTGTRLPTVFWAYPLDYVEKEAAGQVRGSSKRYTIMSGTSELFFLLNGYAVLDNVAMPVVGPTETVYDTFVDQVVANAKAAIGKAVELGVTDPDRIGVGGHSHGALMTANLLAYSDLFRAGIARSGAFNHTLRPFGFQNEKRTLWQASDVYIKISPVLQADKINEPLLLIHGEVDQNPGTVPMQSEKLYEAIRGVGGTVRLVMLPYESHGYQARESTEHVLYEMLSWFDRYVKNAPPRTPSTPSTPTTDTEKK